MIFGSLHVFKSCTKEKKLQKPASFRTAAGKTSGMALSDKSNDCMNHMRPPTIFCDADFFCLMKNHSKQGKQHNAS